MGQPIPAAHLPVCFAKLLSRFLHDKNSREFLYYRKKVAEIRKEAQKLQASSQKGKWVRGWEVLGRCVDKPYGNGVLGGSGAWGGA